MRPTHASIHRAVTYRQRLGVGLALAASATLLGAAPALAADLSLPIDTVVTADEGALIELGRIPVDSGLAGPLCVWEASVTNQDSAHPGNDIVITSGGTTLVLADIEATPGKVTTNSGSVHLADEVVVTLRMGPDGIFSGGLDVDIRYDQCRQTTTVPPVVEVTTVPPVTTAPPPAGPVVSVTTTTTAAVAATVTTAPPPAGPVLPVSGPSQVPALVGGGVSLILVGEALRRTQRSA